jgi:hypothetical protein
LSFTGWSAVLGVNANGGTPDGDFADEGGIESTALRCPYRLDSLMVCVVSDLVGEAGNERRPLRQVVAPIVMILKDLWDAG